MTVLILMRHGATEFNDSSRLQGRLDVPLGARGNAQAADAAARLAADYPLPDALLTSPLLRAADTAAHLAGAWGIGAIADAALTQRSYGAWEGHTWDEVRELWPQEYERRAQGLDPRVDGWENSADVGERVAASLTAWCEGRSLVVAVSHGGAIQQGVLALLGLGAGSRALGSLPHARWHVLRRKGAGEWTLEQAGIAAHDYH